jgi:regulator of sigma E protease
VVLSHDGGQKFESFNSIFKEMLLDDVQKIDVKRNGQVATITLPDDFKKRAIAMGKKHGFIDYRTPCLVDTLIPGGAVIGKLQKGDQILTVDDSSAYYYNEIIPLLQNRKGKEVDIAYLRGTDTSHIKAKVSDKGKIGFGPDVQSAAAFELHTYNFFQSFGVGIVKVYKTGRDYLKQFKLIFSPTIQGWKQMGGIGSMASMYGGEPEDGWVWSKFWAVTALISVILAVMNLLPIPMLDGGYVIILLIEMVMGRPLNEKLLENLQRVGFIIIIFLMVFANGNDLYKFILHKFFHQ